MGSENTVVGFESGDKVRLKSFDNFLYPFMTEEEAEVVGDTGDGLIHLINASGSEAVVPPDVAEKLLEKVAFKKKAEWQDDGPEQDYYAQPIQDEINKGITDPEQIAKNLMEGSGNTASPDLMNYIQQLLQQKVAVKKTGSVAVGDDVIIKDTNGIPEYSSLQGQEGHISGAFGGEFEVEVPDPDDEMGMTMVPIYLPEYCLEKHAKTVKASVDLEKFLEDYLEAALWATTGDDQEPLDSNHSVADIAPETHDRARADCESFIQQAAALPLNDDAGHDFFLTRNGHGAGFWDGDYEKEIGEKLTQIAKGFGSIDFYVGDDNKIYT